jgi:hypothetical protein
VALFSAANGAQTVYSVYDGRDALECLGYTNPYLTPAVPCEITAEDQAARRASAHQPESASALAGSNDPLPRVALGAAEIHKHGV